MWSWKCFLPFGSASRFYDRGHSLLEEVLRLAKVDDVEDDPLLALDVLHGKMEPEANAGVARVWTD